jgi:hypothetical protein
MNWGIPRLGTDGAPNSSVVALRESHSVSLAQTADGEWQYLVDAHPDVIRGVGYNQQYAAINVFRAACSRLAQSWQALKSRW